VFPWRSRLKDHQKQRSAYLSIYELCLGKVFDAKVEAFQDRRRGADREASRLMANAVCVDCVDLCKGGLMFSPVAGIPASTREATSSPRWQQDCRT
jgi:hypothetical protein